jgi:hypothetical protein
MAPLKILALMAMLALARQQPKDGLIELTVRDAVTQKGLGAVRVEMVYLGPESPSTVTTFTDTEERMVARNLVHGNYVLRIGRDRYALPNARSPVPAFPKSVVIDSERKTYQLEGELAPVATVRGRVLDSNGTPLPKATVSLLTLGYLAGQRTFSTAIQAATVRVPTGDDGRHTRDRHEQDPSQSSGPGHRWTTNRPAT